MNRKPPWTLRLPWNTLLAADSTVAPWLNSTAVSPTRLMELEVHRLDDADLLISTLREELGWREQFPAEHWPAAYWKVTSFARDDQEVPALLTDATRWARVRFQAQSGKLMVRWRGMDDSYGPLYIVTVDESERMMRLVPDPSEQPTRPAGPAVLRYTQPDLTHLVLEGTINGERLRATLELLDGRSSLLVSRGFHWINEEPFGR